MIITYQGKQFFKIQQGDLVIALNPISKESKIKDKPSSSSADIVFVTTKHPDYNGVDMVSHGKTVPFVIDGPGEYEVKDLFIRGTESEGIQKDKNYINTIFSFSVDGIGICFLGAISNEKLSVPARESIGTPDIVFVPVGGEGVLSALPAYKLAMSFDPKIIIPMDYGTDMEKDSLKTFLSDAGGEKSAPVSKLTLKKKDLEGKNGEVVVISPL